MPECPHVKQRLFVVIVFAPFDVKDFSFGQSCDSKMAWLNLCKAPPDRSLECVETRRVNVGARRVLDVPGFRFCLQARFAHCQALPGLFHAGIFACVTAI